MAYFPLEDTAMWADIQEVLTADKKTTRFEYRAQIHTESDDINVIKFISKDTVSDYHNNIGEYIYAIMKVPLGDYIKRIYPFRTNLEVSIKRIDLEKDTADGAVKIAKITTDRYKAVFLLKENPPVSGTELERVDYQSLNTMDSVDLKLQLVDRSLEPLRVKQVSGTFQNVTQKQVIHALLAGESQQVLIDGKPAIDGIDIIDPDNETTISNVVIPAGTIVTTIPTLLQEKMKGVYSGGIGTFLQTYKGKRLWFVYPLYNTERFNTGKDQAIFYSLPKERMPSLDKTYRVDGTIVSILTTGDSKYQDSGEVDNMNSGIGFRVANAGSFMKKPVQITEDGPVASRLQVNNEVIVRERKDGVQYAPVSSKMISANPFVECSSVLAKEVSRIDLSWENADPDLIYPGMPCRFTYLRLGEQITLEGTVVYKQSSVHLAGKDINSANYVTNCVVTLLCKINNTLPVVPTGVDDGEW